MARRVLTSPAKGKTTRTQWSSAFKALRHPDDYTVGLRVYWRRGANVMKGYVTKVTYDAFHPAYVRGDDKRTYKPAADTYCNDRGELLWQRGSESLYDALSANRRAANARDKLPKPRAKLRKLMRSKSPWLGAPYGKQLLGAFHESAPFPPGTFVVGSLMGHTEYAPLGVGNHDRGARQWLTAVADYEVRKGTRGADGEWGIYTRDYNVRLATFAPNSASLREALRRMFDIAHIAAEADAKGWYTHGCGQWVNDKLAPCSVCKPKRKRKRK